MKKLLPFIIIILVLIGLVALVPILLQSSARKQQMVDYLSRLLHHKVVIGKMDSNFFPPSFELHEVAAFTEGIESPALQMDRVVIGVGFATLFGGALQPSSVMIDHLTFQSHRRANGSWDTDEWTSAWGAVAGGSQSPLTKVEIHGSECDWIDAFAPSSREVMLKSIEGKLDHASSTTHVSGTLSGAGLSSTEIVFDAQGSFGSSTWTGDMHATDQSRQWTAHLQQQPQHLTITAQSSEWRWDQAVSLAAFVARLPIDVAPDASPSFMQNWKMTVDGGPTGVAITHSAALGGGITEAKLQFSEGAMGLQLQGALAAKNVTLQAACAPWGGCASVEGSVTTVVPHFAVLIATGSSTAFTAEGAFDLRDGVYHVPDTSLQKMTHVHLLKYFKLKYPGLVEKGFVFTHAHAQGSLSGGVLSLRDASLVASGLHAGLAGQLEPMKKAVDAYVRVQITESSPDRLQYIPGKYISGQPGHERVQPVFGRLQGTWDEWLLRALPNYKMPAAIQNQLKKSVIEN